MFWVFLQVLIPLPDASSYATVSPVCKRDNKVINRSQRLQNAINTVKSRSGWGNKYYYWSYFCISDAVHHTVIEFREIQQGKLNRDGQYHIQLYKTGNLHTFKRGSIWIQVLTISMMVRYTYDSSTVTSYIFCFLFADTSYEATSN